MTFGGLETGLKFIDFHDHPGEDQMQTTHLSDGNLVPVWATDKQLSILRQSREAIHIVLSSDDDKEDTRY